MRYVIPIIAAQVVLIVPAASWAHGPAPATIGLPDGATLGEGVVRLSTGAAARDASGRWSYLCPAIWGDPGAPPMVAGADGVWVLGQDGFRLWADGWALARERELSSVRDTAVLGDEAWTLSRRSADDPTTLDSLDTERSLTLARPWSVVAGEGKGFVVARLEDDALEVGWLDADGSEAQVERVVLSMDAASVDLRRTTSGALYAAITGRDDYLLARVTRSRLADLEGGHGVAGVLGSAQGWVRSMAPLDGPVEHDGTLFVTTGGALLAWRGEELVSQSASQRMTCVEPGVACATLGLLVLPEEDGEDLTWTFELEQLHPPRDVDIPEDRRAACEAEWLDFTLHAGLDPAGPTPPTPEPVEPDDAVEGDAWACGIAAQPSERAPADALMLMIGLGVLVTSRRWSSAR